MRITTALLSAVVVGAFGIGPGQAARVLSAHDYEGFWRSTHSQPGFIKFLQIDALDAGRLTIRAWLRCNPASAQMGMLRDCRQWRTDSVAADAFDRIVWVHPEPTVGRNILALSGDTLTVSTSETGWQNDFKRVLGDAVSCLGMPERSRGGAITCNSEGGRDFGKAGKTFQRGDQIFVLLRFNYLPVGEHRIQTRVESRIGNRRTVSTKWAYDATFSNDQESWSVWFPANTNDAGNWTVHLILDGEVSLARVSYCVDCVLE